MFLDISGPAAPLPANEPATASSAGAGPDLADLLVAYLEQMGVEYVFGVPGGAIEPLYNALARSERRGGLRHVLARHESGAAFMADGYARDTGKIGVCASTSGPGATNLLTAVASAYDNQVPLLVLSGQPALPTFGRHPLQESSCTGIDVIGMFRHCTRYNTLVSHPRQLEAKLAMALELACHAPRGPVHLSLPADVLRQRAPVPAPSYDLSCLLRPLALVDDDALALLQGRIRHARQVVLVIGASCADGIETVLQFATLAGAPFVTTPDAKGLVSPQHPLYRGVFGFAGHRSAEEALAADGVDLIIAAGASLGEWNTGGWSAALLNGRLVHIDDSAERLGRSPMACLHVRGSIRAVFQRLLAGIPAPAAAPAARFDPLSMVAASAAWHSDSGPIKPQRLMRELSRMFPPTARFLADTGNSTAWATHYLQPLDRRMGERRQASRERARAPGQRHTAGGWLRTTMNFAAMGWAIGASIGTALAHPGLPVVCITGDGSVLMNGQELSVAVAEHLCVVFVVLNDGALGMVRHGQRLAGAEQLGCRMPPTDFAMLARALGASAHTIHTPADLQALDMPAICSRRGPTLLDVRIDPEEVPPMRSRIRVLAGE
ncbi:MAG TPA: thiamine pyrophosphate-binding protein [Telluria sp.]|nr:thiamine pyrophosphate-binding protein [Telluria sp.]